MCNDSYAPSGGSSSGGSIATLSYETKTLSADVSNNSSPYDATIDELKFDNLEIGEKYIVNAYLTSNRKCIQ